MTADEPVARAGTGAGTGRPAPGTSYRPGAVRLLAVGWWALALLLGGDLLLRGEPGAGWALGLSLLVLSAVLVHALFWQPEVRVDADGLELVNVLRRVRLPWSAVEDLDTRWALSVGVGGRRWTSWAAPASGRRMRPVSRRETPWAERGAEGIAGSKAPGSSAGEAAVLVENAWQTWKDRPGPREGAGPADVQVRWNLPAVVPLALAAAAVLVSAAATALS